jgi:hypothetical protein
MEYLTRDELVRLFKISRDHNKLHHLAMLVGLLHGVHLRAVAAQKAQTTIAGMSIAAVARSANASSACILLKEYSTTPRSCGLS